MSDSWQNEGWCIDASVRKDEMQVLRDHFVHFFSETKLSDSAVVSFDLTMTVGGFRALLERLP